MSKDFTDLVAWQESVALVTDLRPIVGGFQGPGAVQAGDQVLRSAESIPANIAEGYARGFGADCVRFLRIAASSAAETESHLLVAVATGRVRKEVAEPIRSRARRVRALTIGLQRWVMSRR